MSEPREEEDERPPAIKFEILGIEVRLVLFLFFFNMRWVVGLG